MHRKTIGENNRNIRERLGASSSSSLRKEGRKEEWLA
jgi:hypothetical protein